jgi:hypothetical protein
MVDHVLGENSLLGKMAPGARQGALLGSATFLDQWDALMRPVDVSCTYLDAPDRAHHPAGIADGDGLHVNTQQVVNGVPRFVEAALDLLVEIEKLTREIGTP